jgi:putative hydrolase of the HAD superfamily
MITENRRPKVIFLDAVGTLFGVRGSVGDRYASLANKFGVEVSAEVLNRAFVESFKLSPLACFPEVDRAQIQRCEYDWWYAIALNTFEKAGVLNQFQSFDDFFAELYAYFATDDPWFVYPDVPPVLEKWQKQGIELGILSNFDSRIYDVLKVLNLAKFFSSVTISTEVGAAKPDPLIFTAALQKYNCPAEYALHIGDSLKDDYQGAIASGLQALWLEADGVRVELNADVIVP